MTTAEIMQKLAAPFASSDVEWRVQHTNNEKDRGLAVPFIDSRAIQERLDTVLGAFHWRTEFRPWHQVRKTGKNTGSQREPDTDAELNASQLCGLAIYCEERGEWIIKFDGAENSDIEPVKGGISDSFKRAAVLWGIGRYLYKINPVWVAVEKKGRSFVIPASERPTLDRAHEAAVKRIFGVAAPAGTQSGAPAGEKPAGAARRSPAGKAPASLKQPDPIPFDYTVKSAVLKNFSSGKSMVLTLHDPRKNRSVTAFLQGEHPEIAEGVCLREVQISRRGSDANAYNTLDAYQIAA